MMSTLDHLLELQSLDTAIDQAQRRLQHLPERAAALELTSRLTAVQAEITGVERSMAESEQRLAAIEASGRELASKSSRLEEQLRTVIAIREAEALQHQIAGLGVQRSELDDQGLALIEESEQMSSTVEVLRGQLPTLEEAVAKASAALAAAEDAVQGELADLRVARAATAAEVAPTVLERYEAMRRTHGGVAIARLHGSRCEGCHLDLSRSEVEALRTTTPGEPGECPSCGRMLVLQA